MPRAGATARIRADVREALGTEQRILLAVSGGVDSMVLLSAAAAVVPVQRLIVASFDHATGPHSKRAVALVCRYALSVGIPVVTSVRAAGAEPGTQFASEATLREERMQFLETAARSARGISGAAAVVATAHTLDDQIETVLMRIMRGAGARGLAGLRARTSLRRPLLDVSHEQVLEYATANGIEWLEDPSNRSRRYFRNRVRHDLLPALRAARPEIDRQLAAIGEEAARWRLTLERVVDEVANIDGCGEASHSRGADHRRDGDRIRVEIDSLEGYSRAALAVLWPPIVAQAGITMDWRGTHRLVEFTINGRTGATIQLSGGWEVARSREHIHVRRLASKEPNWPPPPPGRCTPGLSRPAGGPA